MKPEETIQCYQCGTRVTVGELVHNNDDCPECGAAHTLKDVAKAFELNAPAEVAQGEAVAYIPVDRETGEQRYPVKYKGTGHICDYVPLYTAEAKPDADHLPAYRRKEGVMGCKRFMTQKCYDAQRPEIKARYEPFHCANCLETKPDAELVGLMTEAIPSLHNLSERAMSIEYFNLAERFRAKLAELHPCSPAE